MALKKVLDLSRGIDNCRMAMYELAKDKELSDPAVVKISQQLDRKIMKLQKLMYASCSS